MKTKHVVMVVGIGLQLAALVGCGGSGGDGTDSGGSDLSQGASPSKPATPATPAKPAMPGAAASVTVTVTSRSVTGDTTGSCTAEGNLPTITASTPALTASLAKIFAIPSNVCSTMGDGLATATFELGANDHGIFSLSWFLNLSSVVHGFDDGVHTVDLGTGKELALTDVFTADGVGVLTSTCAASLVDQGQGQIDQTFATEELCKDLGFLLTDTGVRPLPDLPSAMIGLEVPILPWSELAGKTQPVVADYVKAHGG